MGLTLHYSLPLGKAPAQKAQALIRRLHRDLEKLRLEIADWNELIAGFVGGLKDGLAGEFDAPITKYPDFEHLEARGRKKTGIKHRP